MPGKNIPSSAQQVQPKQILHVPTSGYEEGQGWRVYRITEGQMGMEPTDIILAVEYKTACAWAQQLNEKNEVLPRNETAILLAALFVEDPTATASAYLGGMPKVYTIRGSNPAEVAKLWLAKDLRGWLKALGNQDLLTLVEDGKSWADIATNFDLNGWDIARYRIGLETLRRMGEDLGRD